MNVGRLQNHSREWIQVSAKKKLINICKKNVKKKKERVVTDLYVCTNRTSPFPELIHSRHIKQEENNRDM